MGMGVGDGRREPLEPGPGLAPILRKSRYILTEEGLGVWLDRAIRFATVKARRALQDKTQNLGRWQELKGSMAGKRAFLVGNGPSLNRTPLHLLRDEDCICFNRFHLMFERVAWRPKMYAIVDDRVAKDMGAEIAEEVLPHVEYAFFPDIHPYNVDFRKFIPDIPSVFWLYLDRFGFSEDLPYAGLNKTVANVALQVLAHMGYDPIYLIGVDMDYQVPASVVQESKRDLVATANDDPNHFDPRYFGAGRKYHVPRMDETVEKYREGKVFCDRRRVRVYNATVGGKLEVFPRVNLRSLFPQISAGDEVELLQSALNAADAVPVERHIRGLPVEYDWPTRPPACWLPTSTVAPQMNSILRTHLLFGPTEDEKYLAAARRGGPAWREL